MTPWPLACPDWESRLRQGRSPICDLPGLDVAAGDRAVAIFDKLRLADVPGTPTLAQACGDWFRDIVRALFGSLDPVTRERAIRELFLLVPKKNSKTTYGALLMLTALLLNARPKALFIMTAPVQDVAEMAFDTASGAIKLDPVLQKLLHVRDHLKIIVHRQTGATLEIMTFDPAVLTGQKVSGALIDELHVVAKMSKADKAIRQIRGGMLSFPEAFLAFITTQSEDAPAGVFRAELSKARDIRDGRRQGPMLPVLYEFTEAQQRSGAWEDPALWSMVTPNAGRSLTIGRLREEFATARATGVEELRAWASQHLDVEIGLALHESRWTGADFWETQGTAGLDLDEVIARSDVLTAGIDGGGLDDLLGLVVLGRDKQTHDWLCWAHAWAHPKVLERRKSIAPRLLDFAASGDLTLVESMGEDVKGVADVCVRLKASGKLDRIGLDPAGVSAIVDAIEAAGIDRETKVVGISQGWRLTGAIKTTERRLAEGTLHHGDSPLMAWCVGNARPEQKGNAIAITKQTAGTAKIDPLMALFDAVSLMALNPQPKQYQFF